jgi:exosortase family protein XrtM
MDSSYGELLASESRRHASRRQPWRLAVVFLPVFFALQYAWEMSRGSEIERFVIDVATVSPAAWVISALQPEHSVSAQGHSLVSPTSRLNILNGCEGLETLFMLIAAFVAYPFSWRARLVGLLMGTVLVFVLNQARIVLLWQSFLHNRALFSALHGTVLPLVMVACCLFFFMVFIARHEVQPG